MWIRLCILMTADFDEVIDIDHSIEVDRGLDHDITDYAEGVIGKVRYVPLRDPNPTA